MEINTEKNIERFEQLIGSVKRDGMDKLIEFIKKSDFYTAPASTRYHLSVEGGLLQHSLDVYDCLIEKKRNGGLLGKLLENVSDETIIITSLLHDLCKTYYYGSELKNQKTYDEEKVKAANPRTVKHDQNGDFIWETVPAYNVDNKYPLGHGQKSVFFILQYIKLSMQEIAAIQWHMGAYSGQQDWNDIGAAYEKYPLCLAIHEADMEATHLIEVEDK